MEVNKSSYSDESNLRISEDVLATIAKTATAEIQGVAGLAATPAQGVRRVLGKKGEARGISLSFVDGEAVVDISVNVRYGAKIQTVAEKVQERVKETIENMTGIVVGRVNVSVAGLVFETENRKARNQ